MRIVALQLKEKPVQSSERHSDGIAFNEERAALACLMPLCDLCDNCGSSCGQSTIVLAHPSSHGGQITGAGIAPSMEQCAMLAATGSSDEAYQCTYTCELVKGSKIYI